MSNQPPSGAGGVSSGVLGSEPSKRSSNVSLVNDSAFFLLTAAIQMTGSGRSQRPPSDPAPEPPVAALSVEPRTHSSFTEEPHTLPVPRALPEVARQVSAPSFGDRRNKPASLNMPPPLDLPPPPPSEPRLRVKPPAQPIFHSFDVRQKLLTNPKRYAIRHTPSVTYQTLFAKDTAEPIKERKMKLLEGSIRAVDPRKPSLAQRRRSLTILPRKGSCNEPATASFVSRSSKRRSSLPLEAKLNLIGIEVPPVTLEILLHEPGREVRSIEVKIYETDHTTVADLLHQLSGELTSLQQTLESISSDDSLSPNSSPQRRKGTRKQTLIQRVGNSFFNRSGQDRVPQSFGGDPMRPRNNRPLKKLKDFGLYWPRKDEWLEDHLEVAHYCFREGTVLDFKLRVRNFKLRLQIEVKLLFPQHGWTKTLTLSPNLASVASIRAQASEWAKEEGWLQHLLLEDAEDDQLLLYGIYLRDSLLEDESKVLSTYNLRARDTLEVKCFPGYSLEMSSPPNAPFMIHLPASCSFQRLVDKLQFHALLASENIPRVTLKPPMGHIESLSLDLSRALLQTNDEFEVCWGGDSKWTARVIRVPKDSGITTESRVPPHIFLEGEKILRDEVEHVGVFVPLIGQRDLKFSATLILTNYRILLELKHQGKTISERGNLDSWISLPFASIQHIQKYKSKDRIRKCQLDINCKNVRRLSLTFTDIPQRKEVFRTFSSLQANRSHSSLFAFSYRNILCTESPLPLPGWTNYSTKAEYQRMGISGFEIQRSGWRLTHLNEQYGLCTSYPSLVAVPACVSDELVASASLFRTKMRLPALSWVHPITGVCLCR